MKLVFKSGFALLMGIAIVWSFKVPDIAYFQAPGFARIFLWHFPCPMLFTLLIIASAWFGLRVFMNPIGFKPETDAAAKARWDLRSLACMELGYVFALLTMATGILFSEVQWGDWWSWDPRQTSFLMVLLIHAAYFAIRAAYTDPDKRAAFGAAYGLLSILPVLFLVYIFPYLPPIKEMSLHPTGSILSGKIKGEYAQCVILILILFSIMTIYLYKLRVRAGLAEIDLENINERLADGGNPTPSGVVRPVSLHD